MSFFLSPKRTIYAELIVSTGYCLYGVVAGLCPVVSTYKGGLCWYIVELKDVWYCVVS